MYLQFKIGHFGNLGNKFLRILKVEGIENYSETGTCCFSSGLNAVLEVQGLYQYNNPLPQYLSEEGDALFVSSVV